MENSNLNNGCKMQATRLILKQAYVIHESTFPMKLRLPCNSDAFILLHAKPNELISEA